MKVHFITHSSFFVETNSCYMLFDYYEGNLPNHDSKKPLFVFASHSHPDHFDDSVFKFAESFDTIHFILSSDIFKSRVPEELLPCTVFISPYEEKAIGSLHVETLKSTDMGVAFVIKIDDKLIYHAGDLNDWVWDGSPDFQNRMMHKAYTDELSKLADISFYCAFVPLDPRQESDFDCGMLGFLEVIKAKYIFPMHMWGDYSVVPRFKGKHPIYAETIMNISSENQSFEI